MKYATCIHCGTLLHPDDPAPFCDHCATVEEEASAQYEAAREAMRQQIRAAQGISWINGKPLPPAEVTPAGLNYLLPGVDPIHTTPPTEGQARLL